MESPDPSPTRPPRAQMLKTLGDDAQSALRGQEAKILGAQHVLQSAERCLAFAAVPLIAVALHTHRVWLIAVFTVAVFPVALVILRAQHHALMVLYERGTGLEGSYDENRPWRRHQLLRRLYNKVSGVSSEQVEYIVSPGIQGTELGGVQRLADAQIIEALDHRKVQLWSIQRARARHMEMANVWARWAMRLSFVALVVGWVAGLVGLI